MWRYEALLSLFGSLPHPLHRGSPPDDAHAMPLSLMCAQASEGVKELRKVAVYMPVQERRNLMRWCAVHAPLARGVLYALLYWPYRD